MIAEQIAVQEGPLPCWEEIASEVERLNRSDPRVALATAERWLAHERTAESAEGCAHALRAYARALGFSGRYELAIPRYEEAEERFRCLGLISEVARTQIGHVTALRCTGRYSEAVDLASRSRAYFLAHGHELQAAMQLMNLGTIYRPTGRLAVALRSYREARTVFRRLRERSFLADVEQNIGNVFIDLGRFEEALRRMRAAERIRSVLGQHSERARTLLNIAILSHHRNDYGRALQALNDARQLYESLDVERGARMVDLQMLRTCSALNLTEEGAAAAERAIEGLRALEMPWELGQALLAAAGPAESSGDQDLARRRVDEARRIFRRMGNPLWEAMACLQHARLVAIDDADSTGATRDAALRKALRQCRSATRYLRDAGALDRAALGMLVEGILRTHLRAPAEALACFSEVLNSATSLGSDHLLFQAHASVGELLEPTDPEAAIESFRRAIDHLEAVRARALADDCKLSFVADKTDLYERAVGLLVRRGSAAAIAEAFSVAERSKSRTLLEELLSSGGSRSRSRRSRVARLARRARDIRGRLNRAYALAYGADQTPSSISLARSGQTGPVEQLEREFGRITRELQLAARGDSDATPSAPQVDVAGIRVPEGVALVEFYTVRQELLAFVKTDGALKLHWLTSLDEVTRLVERLNFHISKSALGSEYLRANLESSRRGIDRCLQGLWQAVIAPLEPDLVGQQQLVVVPHGPLHGLPFHAFHDGERYLVDRFTISYAPSAGVYGACVQAARPLGDRGVIVGIDDPGLPWVAHEVETVARAWPSARVLTGQRATARGLWRHAGKFDVLHLATHAVFRADNPAFSSVKLADAWLTVADLAELARGAQLVTLSACETGVGGLTAGDELVGLTRGLLGAGCSAVVASLWTVNDESTAKLIAHFYAALRGAVEPAAALRSAMLALRAEYDHPYFWAPFMAVGGGRGLVSRGTGPADEERS